MKMMMILTLILTLLIISASTSSRSVAARVAGATTGPTALLLTLVRRLAAVTRGGLITRDRCVLSIAAVRVAAAITVSLLMVFSSAGFILLGIELRHAKMGRIVRGKFVSLHIRLGSFEFCL